MTTDGGRVRFYINGALRGISSWSGNSGGGSMPFSWPCWPAGLPSSRAIDARKEAVGKLYNVEEFAAEIVKAAEDAVPADNTVLVGDTGYFTK